MDANGLRRTHERIELIPPSRRVDAAIGYIRALCPEAGRNQTLWLARGMVPGLLGAPRPRWTDETASRNQMEFGYRIGLAVRDGTLELDCDRGLPAPAQAPERSYVKRWLCIGNFVVVGSYRRWISARRLPVLYGVPAAECRFLEEQDREQRELKRTWEHRGSERLVELHPDPTGRYALP